MSYAPVRSVTAEPVRRRVQCRSIRPGRMYIASTSTYRTMLSLVLTTEAAMAARYTTEAMRILLAAIRTRRGSISGSTRRCSAVAYHQFRYRTAPTRTRLPP